MALPPDLTIPLPVPVTYSLVTQRALSSLRTDSSRSLENPATLNVSHEVQKDGKVSSVVYLDDIATLVATDTKPIVDDIRVQFKVQYNPSNGRTDTEAVLNNLLSQLTTFLGVADNWNRFLNKES